jgi:hypothetical protein
MSRYPITFIPKGRTGNNIFQYMTTLVFSILYNYEYVSYDIFKGKYKTNIYVNDENVFNYLNWTKNISNTPPGFFPMCCDGYFQNSHIFLKYRNEIIERIYKSDIYWVNIYGQKEYIQTYLNKSSTLLNEMSPLQKNIYISIRLDDFIQLPDPTSDILPPTYYLNIIENYGCFDKLYIICDRIKWDWEKRYLHFFNKWNPILLNQSLEDDCALMRECPMLIHSNSTLCWLMSFFSKTKKTRFVPITFHYKHQFLDVIDTDTDSLVKVKSLTHAEVYGINYYDFLKKTSIFSLSYCIPDEIILNEEEIEQVIQSKKNTVAVLIPGNRDTYLFGEGQEAEYYQMYRDAFFACTEKKGGWDCLRHYEIIANGCIPLFKNLDHCPKNTLTTFPKELLIEIYKKNPFHLKLEMYKIYLRKIMEWFRQKCSCSVNANYLLNRVSTNNKPLRNFLLIRGNCGVNYTRETIWIGLKRFSQKEGGIAIEFPSIRYLYQNSEETHLYGNGMTYSKRIAEDLVEDTTEEYVSDKIKSHFWDLIIYGKVGPDEEAEGSLPHLPLWNLVFKNYSKNQIVFLYGGDGCQDMNSRNKYSEHLLYHSNFANCFVRELNFT